MLRMFKEEKWSWTKGGGDPPSLWGLGVGVFRVSFVVKNNVCKVFNGIERDVFHALFEFMLGYIKFF